MSDPQEKRRFKRFLVPVAHYESKDGKHITGVSDVWDVSHSGLRILSPVVVEKGTLLNLRITVQGVVDFVCEGEVRWDGTAPDKKYWLGVNFTRIAPVDIMKLLNYGYDCWLESEKNNPS